MQQSSLQLPTLGNKIFSLRNQGFSIYHHAHKNLGQNSTLLRIEQKPRDCKFSSHPSDSKPSLLIHAMRKSETIDRGGRIRETKKILRNGATRESSCAEDASASRGFCLCTLFDGRDATTYTLNISCQIYIYCQIKQSYW
jgi:hypothetical protein